ncbi:hypothetical protein J6590_072007 [Homalodisca vitripennis]|nr:hypothetical protein J6590_072007 [Homalodisca vitripennis]
MAKASTKDPSLPIQNSDHAMLARCAALCAARSFRKKLTRACKVQAQINSPRFIDTHKTQTELTQSRWSLIILRPVLCLTLNSNIVVCFAFKTERNIDTILVGFNTVRLPDKRCTNRRVVQTVVLVWSSLGQAVVCGVRSSVAGDLEVIACCAHRSISLHARTITRTRITIIAFTRCRSPARRYTGSALPPVFCRRGNSPTRSQSRSAISIRANLHFTSSATAATFQRYPSVDMREGCIQQCVPNVMHTEEIDLGNHKRYRKGLMDKAVRNKKTNKLMGIPPTQQSNADRYLCLPQVLVEYDDMEWHRREWLSIYRDNIFQVFMVESSLVWCDRKDPLAGFKSTVYWPALREGGSSVDMYEGWSSVDLYGVTGLILDPEGGSSVDMYGVTGLILDPEGGSSVDLYGVTGLILDPEGGSSVDLYGVTGLILDPEGGSSVDMYGVTGLILDPEGGSSVDMYGVTGLILDPEGGSSVDLYGVTGLILDPEGGSSVDLYGVTGLILDPEGWSSFDMYGITGLILDPEGGSSVDLYGVTGLILDPEGGSSVDLYGVTGLILDSEVGSYVDMYG